MKTTTLKNINRKLSFSSVAAAASVLAKNNRELVRFEMGPKDHRQIFVAGPRKSVATLCWEWARSTAGLMTKAASLKRKAKTA